MPEGPQTSNDDTIIINTAAGEYVEHAREIRLPGFVMHAGASRAEPELFSVQLVPNDENDAVFFERSVRLELLNPLLYTTDDPLRLKVSSSLSNATSYSSLIRPGSCFQICVEALRSINGYATLVVTKKSGIESNAQTNQDSLDLNDHMCCLPDLT